MPIINGIDFADISSVSGVPKASITSISGVEISQAPSCTRVGLGYSNGRPPKTPSDSCTGTIQFYDFDSVNDLLFVDGFCGEIYARSGFYSDGVTIFFWDGSGGWSEFGACGR